MWWHHHFLAVWRTLYIDFVQPTIVAPAVPFSSYPTFLIVSTLVLSFSQLVCGPSHLGKILSTMHFSSTIVPQPTGWFQNMIMVLFGCVCRVAGCVTHVVPLLSVDLWLKLRLCFEPRCEACSEVLSFRMARGSWQALPRAPRPISERFFAMSFLSKGLEELGYDVARPSSVVVVRRRELARERCFLTFRHAGRCRHDQWRHRKPKVLDRCRQQGRRRGDPARVVDLHKSTESCNLRLHS